MNVWGLRQHMYPRDRLLFVLLIAWVWMSIISKTANKRHETNLKSELLTKMRNTQYLKL